MTNPWFRMYSEFAHDPKVQMMTEVMQRRYIMLMCLRCSNNLVTLHETEIAFQLRISEEEMAETKALFIKKGFIDDKWNLLNWDKRQFSSDTSKSRVAKYRALQKEKQSVTSNDDVTLQKRQGNALDTDTDTDTDTEKKKEPKGSKKTVAEKPLEVPEQVWNDWLVVRKAKRAGAPTLTVINQIEKEADKANMSLEAAITECAARSWIAFKAEYVADKQRPASHSTESPWAKAQRERMAEWAPNVAARAPDDRKIIDITPKGAHDGFAIAMG